VTALAQSKLIELREEALISLKKPVVTREFFIVLEDLTLILVDIQWSTNERLVIIRLLVLVMCRMIDF
jgi:hypothetical protein